jgi:uncharacterized OB-fold protein
MADNKYDLPLPVKQPESDFYWDKAKEHELWLRKCNSCNKAYFYPRDFCPKCHSKDVTWIKSAGKGILYAFSIVHRSPPPFLEKCPYITALVELEDGVRIPTNLVDVEPDPEQITIGMPVQVVFDDVTEEITLPKFKPS